MIKLDYTLLRNEGDRERPFKLDQIPSEIPSVLTCIEGPNGIGKSTLLNIIALGFFGDKLSTDDLNQSLLNKINGLKDFEHQKLKYNIEIYNEILDIKLRAQKTDFETNDIQVFHKIGLNNEQIIDFNSFKKQYRLLYDIPTNPAERFKNLLIEIAKTQSKYEAKIEDLHKGIDEVIANIQSGKNPEYLKELAGEIEDLKKEQKNLLTEKSNENSIYKSLKTYFTLKCYIDNIDRLSEITSKVKDFQRAKDKSSKSSEKASRFIENISQYIKDADVVYRGATKLLDLILPFDERPSLKIWNNINVHDEIKNPEANQTLKEQTVYFIGIIQELQDSEDNNVKKFNFLNSLSDVLIKYKNFKINIPGTDLLINDFLAKIQNEIKENVSIKYKANNLSDCLNFLKELKNIINLSEKNYTAYKNSVRSHVQILNELNSISVNENKKDIEKELIDIDAKLKSLKSELHKLEFDVDQVNIQKQFDEFKQDKTLSKFVNLTEIQLKETLKEKFAGLNGIDLKLSTIGKEILVKELEIKAYDKKEPHKYLKNVKEIQDLVNIVRRLENRFTREFNEVIKILHEDKINKNALSDNQKDYAIKAGSYLAKKLSSIKYIDVIYELKTVDLINKKIITKSGKIIDYDDLSTGQGQGAYLEGLLKINDNRKIIVLFDEVAMMDSKTLGRIYDILLDLYRSKKLLCAIIVQKAEEVKIHNLML